MGEPGTHSVQLAAPFDVQTFVMTHVAFPSAGRAPAVVRLVTNDRPQRVPPPCLVFPSTSVTFPVPYTRAWAHV